MVTQTQGWNSEKQSAHASSYPHSLSNNREGEAAFPPVLRSFSTFPISSIPRMHIILILALCLLMILLLVPSSSSAEPVSVTVTGRENRDFLHPGEEMNINVDHLDSITNISITGPTSFTLDQWENLGGTFSTGFVPSPEIEGRYQVVVIGLQDGKEKTGNAGFRVESFHLRLFPTDTTVISSPDDRGWTYLNAELRDWKGDPLDGRIEVTITRVPLQGNADPSSSELIGSGPMSIVNGTGQWTYMFPAVNDSTLYRFQARLVEPDVSTEGKIAAECGVVVHPFDLRLWGEREVLEGGGAIINGPFLPRETVEVGVFSAGEVTSITLSDLLTGESMPLSGTTLPFVPGPWDKQIIPFFPTSTTNFTPENASIYKIIVESEYQGFSASSLMLIIVNDWDISVQTYEMTIPGTELVVPVHRDNGAFFGVRSLILDPDSLPIDSITEIISSGNSASPLFEKALLDSEGDAELTFLTETNMPEGEYLLVTGIGSWDDGVDYHGITFSEIMIERPSIRSSFVGQTDQPIKINVGPLPLYISGRRATYFSSQLDGSIFSGDQTFRVENGTAWLLFNETGTKACTYTSTGRDVTSFTITVHGHSIQVSAPDTANPEENVTVSFTNESGRSINSGPISYLVTRNGIVETSGTLDPGTSSLIIHPTMPGLWTVIILAPDHVRGEASFTVSTIGTQEVSQSGDTLWESLSLLLVLITILFFILAGYVAWGAPGGRS